MFLSPEKLVRRLPRLRSRKTVVFTNGCFDLIHAGHLKVLEFCKKQGDILIVALNNDASVRRNKGSKRPFLSLQERGALMAALKPVDYVTWFSEDTPCQLLRRLRLEVLVKGGDWKSEEILGREFVKKVVRVPLLKGRSTTVIVQDILRKFST